MIGNTNTSTGGGSISNTIKIANFLINGNPSIINNTISNFSDNNYFYPANKIMNDIFTLQQQYAALNTAVLSNADNWEMMIKIFPTDLSIAQSIISCQQSTFPTLQFGWTSNQAHLRYLNLSLSSDGYTWIYDSSNENYLFEEQTVYYIRLYYDKINFSVDVATDGINFINLHNVEINNLYCSGTPYFGAKIQTSDAYFRGDIDLSQLYIKINGQMYWNALKEVPVGQVTINI